MPRAPAKPKAAGTGEKRESGLTKPMSLSPALATIVGAKKDEKLARSEIIKRLWAYLKEKNLQVEYMVHTGKPLADKTNKKLLKMLAEFNKCSLSRNYKVITA